MASSSSSISSSCSSFPIAQSSTSQSSSVQSSSSVSRTYSYPTSFPQNFLPTDMWLEIIRYVVSPEGEEDPSLSARTLCELRASGQFFADLVDNDLLGHFWKTLAINRPCPSFQRFMAEASNNAYAALPPGAAPSYSSRFAHLTESFKRRGITLQEGCPILFHPCQYDVVMCVFDVNLERVWAALVRQGVPRLANAQDIRQELYNNDPEKQEQIRSVNTLDLGGHDLTVVPPEIGLLTGLKRLNFGDNFLRILPPEIGRLTRLNCFGMRDNNGFATFPPEIIQLSGLRLIDIRGTHLAKTYPAGLSPEIQEFLSSSPPHHYLNRMWFQESRVWFQES